MKITNSLYSILTKYCTSDLLESIDFEFDDDCVNEWDITELIEDTNAMKIAFVYEVAGGHLFLEGEQSTFITIAKDDNRLNNIRQFWDNNIRNGDTPVFDNESIDVPRALPMYVSVPTEEGRYTIEKLFRGEYRRIRGEIYTSEDAAKERAKELNENT